METLKRFFRPPNSSYFLFGPRGTGKSTLTKLLHPDALFIDLLKPDLYRKYFAHPERLSEIVSAYPEKGVFVIDEVQRAPGLLPVVHDLIERNKKQIFVLTGSSARKLKKTGSDLMAGRALKKILYPFMACEIKEKFSLINSLKVGMIPLIIASRRPEETLESYITLYMNEEIQAEGLVRNLENFARFLEVISFSHASILNVANISRECQVKRKTVENYIQILEDLLLSFKFSVFTNRAKRELSNHPKFYFFDAGVFNTLRPKGILDITTEIEGAALEGLVAQHLLAWRDYSNNKAFIGFWRTKFGVEVDFVVHTEHKIYAIEVKNNKNVNALDLKGLSAFNEDYPEATCIFLYRGNERIKKKNILCIPVEEFLLNLTPEKNII